MEVHERLQDKSLLHNPFTGAVRCWIGTGSELKDYYAVSITPVYPPFYWIAPVYLVVVGFFTWPDLLTWWSTPGLILLGLAFFWSRLFYYFMMVLGISRNVKGITFKLRPLSYKQVILRIIKR